jgi:AbrB family looped-hinge helix DNA binding protein
MGSFSTTKLSSKGQIVIPERIRNQLELTTGQEFVVVAEKDIIVLKLLHPPNISRYNRVINRAHRQARQVSKKKAARLLAGRQKRIRK